MHAATLIYLLSGLTYLGIFIAGSLTQGLQLASLLNAAVACAFLLLAYHLHHSRKHIRRSVVAVSTLIIIAYGYALVLLIGPPQFFFEVEKPLDYLLILGALSLFILAHASVVVTLFISWRRHPNQSKQRTGVPPASV